MINLDKFNYIVKKILEKEEAEKILEKENSEKVFKKKIKIDIEKIKQAILSNQNNEES